MASWGLGQACYTLVYTGLAGQLALFAPGGAVGGGSSWLLLQCREEQQVADTKADIVYGKASVTSPGGGASGP